jgi:hypothetical protein
MTLLSAGSPHTVWTTQIAIFDLATHKDATLTLGRDTADGIVTAALGDFELKLEDDREPGLARRDGEGDGRGRVGRDPVRNAKVQSHSTGDEAGSGAGIGDFGGDAGDGGRYGEPGGGAVGHVQEDRQRSWQMS